MVLTKPNVVWLKAFFSFRYYINTGYYIDTLINNKRSTRLKKD